MSRDDRRAFFHQYGVGLTLLVAMYVLITILRSVRSDFAPELWAGLGVDATAHIYAWTELAVAFGVLILNGSAVLIADNRRAFRFAMKLAIIGPIIAVSATASLHAGLSPYAFMVLQGVGLYLPYFAVHTTIFERLIAMTRDRGNIGYLMYLADAFGYLGYVVVLITRNLARPIGGFLPFYEQLSTVIASTSIATMIPCWRYFAAHSATRKSKTPATPLADVIDAYGDAEANS